MAYYSTIKKELYTDAYTYYNMDKPQNPLHLVKEASHKKPYNIWFHLYEVYIKHKSVQRESRLVIT